MRQTTKQAAKGKWDGVLTELVGPDAIRRKHGPCPLCGGTDRYRYDNKRGDGDWFCNVCGPGDGFRLIQGFHDVGFAEAAKMVDKLLYTRDFSTQPFTEDIDLEKRRRDMNEVWSGACEPQVVSDYLTRRGITPSVIEKIGDVRGHPNLYWKSSNGMLCDKLPAMVALVRNDKGKPISIHRTYVMQTGSDKKLMPPLEKTVGGFIKLGEPDDTLLLAEGIETALAGWQISGYPAWALISAHNMENFTAIPKHVQRVVVCADNDHSFVGQAAAFKCAAYIKNRIRIETRVWMPRVEGHDMLDVASEWTPYWNPDDVQSWGALPEPPDAEPDDES